MRLATNSMNPSQSTARIKRLLDQLKAEGLEDAPIVLIPARLRHIQDEAHYDPDDDERPEFVKKDEQGWRKSRRL